MTGARALAESRAAHIEAQIDELVRVLAQTGDDKWVAGPDAAEWSGAQVCGHIVEMLPYWAETARTLAAQPGLTFGREREDENRLGGVRTGAVRGRHETIEQLRAAAARACEIVRALPDSAWEIQGTSLSGEPLTVRDIIDRSMISHLEEHIEQVGHAVSS